MFRQRLKKEYSFTVYKVEDLKKEIEELYYKMGGVKSIDYSKTKGSTNSEAINEFKLTISDDIAYLEQELKIHQLKLDQMNDVLNELEDCDKEMFVLKYLKHKTYYEIGKIYYLTASAVSKRMTRALEEV